ncbi:MAG: hypothetical protein H6819_10495 [Phycisphaerales bacterium]|nr:hypothetical protein [Phycisphaerales bacterium]MCB9855943.1 hypothetical protein [Phycisphaerales bacterium]MCB9864076.1 hypothetical protein [Phycisphaerales bacterium]
MRTTDFMPDAGGAFDAWQENFVAYAVAHSKALGLSDGDVEKLQEQSVTWQKHYAGLAAARAAYAEAASAKALAMKALKSQVRSLVARIQDAESTSDAMRAALGITIRDSVLTPSDVPTSVPLISVDTSERLRHTLHFADSRMPTRRAKPKGVIGAEIWVHVGGATPSIDPPSTGSLAPFGFVNLATRTPAVVEFGGADGGKTASYVLRWVNTRGERGPLSAVASATVGG